MPSVKAEIVDGKLVMRGMQVNRPGRVVVTDLAEALSLLEQGGEVIIHTVGLPAQIKEAIGEGKG